MFALKCFLMKGYYLIRLYIEKRGPQLARRPFIYVLFQKLFRIPRLDKFIQYIGKETQSDITANFNDMEEFCLNGLIKTESKKDIYILFPFPSVGEYALSFITLRKFLSNYNGNVYIICSENTLDIAKIFGMYFDIKGYFTIPIRIDYCNQEIIETYIKIKYSINQTINMGNYLYRIGFSREIPLKSDEIFGYLRGVTHFENSYTQIEGCKKISKNKKYIYSDIDMKKLKNIFSYLENNNLIICNFESKSLRSCIDDKIEFSDYISKISEIARKQNLRFVVNSVYNNEKLYKDDNILITRLNFQEIIWLAEHNKIKLFISERNGLNDVFKVFYPTINQIIIYPNYYRGNVSKTLFKKKLNPQYNLKNIYSLKGDNIKELIRSEYDKNIENFIMKNI